MRVTIQKTVDLEDIPNEINDLHTRLFDSFEFHLGDVREAKHYAENGRYIDSSNSLERVRKSLVDLDKMMEELQSLSLSYEKIRIANQMPEHSQPSEDTDD